VPQPNLEGRCEYGILTNALIGGLDHHLASFRWLSTAAKWWASWSESAFLKYGSGACTLVFRLRSPEMTSLLEAGDLRERLLREMRGQGSGARIGAAVGGRRAGVGGNGAGLPRRRWGFAF
jgi:hypothetical protein